MGPFILFWMNVSLSKSNYLLVETDKFKSPTQRQNDDVIHTNLRMKGVTNKYRVKICHNNNIKTLSILYEFQNKMLYDTEIVIDYSAYLLTYLKHN